MTLSLPCVSGRGKSIFAFHAAMQDHRLRTWADRLESIASSVLAGTPAVDPSPDPARARAWIEGFADEFGHRRALDAAVLGRLVGLAPPPMPSSSPDVELWWSLFGSEPVRCAPAGPMTEPDPGQAIELWSQVELACLHAAWDAAIDRRDARLRERCLEATRWHVAELQPDNATAHAWALHGFALLAHESGSAEAWIHAEMVLHASLLGMGRPDRFSACLMLDAARTLRNDR